MLLSATLSDAQCKQTTSGFDFTQSWDCTKTTVRNHWTDEFISSCQRQN